MVRGVAGDRGGSILGEGVAGDIGLGRWGREGSQKLAFQGKIKFLFPGGPASGPLGKNQVNFSQEGQLLALCWPSREKSSQLFPGGPEAGPPANNFISPGGPAAGSPGKVNLIVPWRAGSWPPGEKSS